MNTNLVVTVVVALVTNAVEIFPTRMVPDPPPKEGNQVFAVYVAHPEAIPNPKVKWINTNVFEDTTFSFEWNGQRVSSVREVLLTNWTTSYDRADSWVKSSTNRPQPGPFDGFDFQSIP